MTLTPRFSIYKEENSSNLKTSNLNLIFVL